MPSYAKEPPKVWQQTVVDTFERTSRYKLETLQWRSGGYFDSISRSEFLARLKSFEKLERSLSLLESVPDDWNMYGSPAPSDVSIDRARKILEALKTEGLLPKRVLPSAEGGVAFVFMSVTDNRAVIESLNSEEAFILLYDRRGTSKTLDWPQERSNQKNLLDTLRDHLRGTSLAAS